MNLTALCDDMLLEIIKNTQTTDYYALSTTCKRMAYTLLNNQLWNYLLKQNNHATNDRHDLELAKVHLGAYWQWNSVVYPGKITAKRIICEDKPCIIQIAYETRYTCLEIGLEYYNRSLTEGGLYTTTYFLIQHKICNNYITLVSHKGQRNRNYKIMSGDYIKFQIDNQQRFLSIYINKRIITRFKYVEESQLYPFVNLTPYDSCDKKNMSRFFKFVKKDYS